MPTNKSRTARKKQIQKQKKPLWKKLLLSLFIFIVVIGLGGVATFGYFIATAPKLDVEKLDVAYSSQFLDKEGNTFADIGSENRIKIVYDDLPEELIHAVTATEDARFFDHPGIDIRRIGGAIIANIKHGFGSEGASTITQQVVENMFLTPEKSIKLKVQEQWLALKLEREFSKEQILEMYLNKIFYGANAYGVAKAAEVYFGVEDLHELTLVQSAMLAGLPQRPTAYNPFENPDLMQGRVDTVLTLMVRHGKITQAEADEARKIDVATVLTDKKPQSLPYEAFVQQVEAELEEKLPDVNINAAGLKIYTNLDQNIQKRVEFLLTDSDENPIPYPDEDLQAGMAVVDTKTGEIRAIGGSRNRENVRGDNYAIHLKRQPGSTIKPIVSYGPAIEYEKWSTYHQINDEPYTPPGSKQIRNYNRSHRGWLSMREALRDSLNVPAAKTLVEIGSDRAKPFAENLGLEFVDKHLDPRDAIGGTASTVTPLQLAGAYSAFGNEGIYTTPHAVTKVEFPDGSILDLKPDSEAVMADYTAYMITDMLKDVITSGTGTRAAIPGLPVAGKTGTTNVEGKDGANNSWFAGYSTNYSIGIWTGYKEDKRIMPNTQIPHALFVNTMAEISKDMETADFTKPGSVIEVAVEKGSNPPALPSAHTPKENIVTELFVKGTEPTAVSEKFDQLEPVSNLTATYKEEANAIDISWAYDMEDADVTFEVSYKEDGGDFKQLTSTTELGATMNQVTEGSTYTIQVVVVSNENGQKSEAKQTTVKIAEEEEEPEEIEVPPVQNLQASYNQASAMIHASWQYHVPGATFEVVVNGNKQTIQATSIEIKGASPGTTYSITITPIVESNRGEPRSTSITIEQEQPQDNEDINEDSEDVNTIEDDVENEQ